MHPRVLPSNGILRDQRNFRVLLKALSCPGRLFRLQALEALGARAATLAVAECLLDHEVGFSTAGRDPTGALAAAITAATGARKAGLPEADFVFIAGADGQGAVGRARRGSIDYPDAGATLVYSLDAQSTRDAGHFRIRLSGPGIPEADGIAPAMREIPAAELQELQAVNADYPLGVDALFVRPNGELMALPRSTRIRLR
jgi:alpha-D-ribose 1-methylphosphonate 5-triphosphate synthase subunit PhnH